MSTPQQPIPTGAELSVPPSQLAELTLPQPSPEPAGTSSVKESVSPTSRVEGQQFSSFISVVHSYLWSAITFADQKAALLFATDSAFLGYLLSNGLLHQLKPPIAGWHAAQWAALISLLFLGLSIALAIHVVMPRLAGKHDGLIYFMAIANRKKREQYVAEVLSCTDSSFSVALAEHSYEVARIATRKYTHLRTGMWVGILGFVAGLAYIGLTQ